MYMYLITACNCDALGSQSLVCDYTTGQCPCQLSVGVRGVPNVLGLLDDLQCRSCQSAFFGHYSGNGCQPCGCNALGSNQTTQCNDYGVCNCKPTITGDKCDRCQSGYFSFSGLGCTQCNCSLAGSTSADCNPTTGICACKINAQGGKCDSCVADSFNLAASNPVGCQKCFCYGHGTQCTQAAGFTGDSVVAENIVSWMASSPMNPNDATHSKAPAAFLGNHLSTYGTTMTLYVRARGGASVVYNGHQPIILTGIVNNEVKSVFFRAENFTADSGEAKILRVGLFEDNWYYNDTNTIDYFNFYAILAELTSIELQRKFGNEYIDITNVTLHTTRPAGANDVQLSSVENCTCSSALRNVGGLSCQECAQGYRRTQANSTSYETCIACVCNSRGETTPPICDQITGECLNCRNGTNGTQCESCSAFVTGVNCDSCVANYWGIAKDGCRACDCHSEGSSTTTCDQTTGQCTCRAHVVGRKCDECEDNYESLTNAGCTECDACYGLVMGQVNDLRAMRDNLTALVTELEQQDNNTELGAFSGRLQSTISTMQSLIQYLVEAKRVEGTVGSEIDRLNITLNDLRFQLDINTEQALLNSNISLRNVTNNIALGQDLINRTITTVIDANNLMTSQVYSYGSRMENLLSALKYVENYLTTVSSGALKDIFNVGFAVQEIERNSAQSRTQAQNTLQNAQANNQIHQSTTTRVANLEIFQNSVDAFGQETSQRAQYAVGNATKTLNDVTAARNSANALQLITESEAQIQAAAGRLKAQAEDITLNANNASVTNQSVVQRVRDAKLQTDQLQTRIGQLTVQSHTLNNRTLVAFTKTQNAAFLEQETFTAASRMLEVMKDFGTRSAAIEREANVSLATVQSLRQSAESAISNAAGLQTSLQRAEVNSRVAKDLATETKNIEAVNNAEMQSVNTRVLELSAYSNAVLNNVQAQSNDVLSKNATLVANVQNNLDTQAAGVAALEAKANDATTQASNASTRTAETQARLASIVTSFQNVANINQAGIGELRDLVQQHRLDFDARLLRPVVQKLKLSMDEQRVWLEAMKLRRSELQNQILRMRNVKDQLSKTVG